MEEQAANIILKKAGPQDKFIITWGLFTFRLSIKPIIAKDFIKICKQTSKIKTITENDINLFQAALLHGGDIKYIARAIAIATGTFHRRLVTEGILGLDFDNIERLWKIVQRQSDPQRFFFIIIAAGKMNILKKQEKQ